MEIIISLVSAFAVLLLFCFAGKCSAIMDTISDHDDVHLKASIYANENPLWYDKSESWTLKHDRELWLKNLPEQYNYLKKVPFSDSISDEWHLRKTYMLLSLGLAPILACLIQLDGYANLLLIPFFGLIGLAFNKTFMYYYNNKLKTKTQQ